ncbi:MAG: hypothetical protein PHO58_05595, partial [Bacilli bacterium]|nr:hypothetical protein [Bacilli bacterium]
IKSPYFPCLVILNHDPATFTIVFVGIINGIESQSRNTVRVNISYWIIIPHVEDVSIGFLREFVNDVIFMP